MKAALLLLVLLLPAPARAGEAAALFERALRLELGLGAAPDPAAARGIMCRAAAMGHDGAAHHLAATLLLDGPDYDPAAAAAWLRFAQWRRAGVARVPPDCPGGGASLVLLAESLAGARGVDPLLAKALIAVESGWRHDAVSSAGARGLMQLMPSTAERHGVVQPFDPGENLRAGLDHLALLLRRFGGDEALALAAYHAGEGRVAACRCVPGPGETVAYVRRVLTLAARPGRDRAAPASRAASAATVRAPSPPD